MSAASTGRKYSIVLYGATGYTGKLIAQYLANRIPKHDNNVLIALAARNQKKLEALKVEIHRDDFDTIIADLQDQSAVDRMAAQTKVVIAAAGPFDMCGEAVISACIKEKTDYVDITGEVPWVARMMEKYNDTARRNGSVFVPMSGFDSVPSDISAYYAVRQAQQELKQAIASVACIFRAGGSASGGTMRSIFNLASSKDNLRRMRSPLSLSLNQTVWEPSSSSYVSDGQIQRWVAPMPDFVRPCFDSLIQKYRAPFIMAGANTRVVRRSAALSAAARHPYGSDDQPFRYQEYAAMTSLFQAVVTSLVMVIMGLVLALPLLPKLAYRLAPASGNGPSQASRQKNSWHVTAIARTQSAKQAQEAAEKTLVATIKSDMDPYDFTAVSASECALLLATERASLPACKTFGGGGFLTPATAFGDNLVEKLEKYGNVSFAAQER